MDPAAGMPAHGCHALSDRHRIGLINWSGSRGGSASSLGTTPGPVRLGLGIGPDVADLSADGTPAIPMPAVLIMDADGVIWCIDVHPDYTTRTDVAQILGALDELDG